MKKMDKKANAANKPPKGKRTMGNRFLAAGHRYVPEMYQDGYFPNQLVDKVAAKLDELAQFLDTQARSAEEAQAKCDSVVDAINELQEDFEDAGSEIETAARDSIGTTVEKILEVYGIAIDIETAIRNRDW